MVAALGVCEYLAGYVRERDHDTVHTFASDDVTASWNASARQCILLYIHACYYPQVSLYLFSLPSVKVINDYKTLYYPQT